MILGKSAKYVLNYMEIFDRVNQINTNNISKYIDTWIEINKELLKASLVSKIAQFNRADSPFKHSIDELTELVEFGKMLSENQVIYAEFDKIMNSIDRVSEAGNKFEEDKVELFKRQQTEIRKFVKTINSIDVEATDKLSRLLEGFAKLGLNVKDLNRLVEAITNDLARSLTQLSKEMNSVGKVISNETKRKDKRSKVIQTSVKNISDLVNRELTVIVKNEKSGSTGKNTSTGTVETGETPAPEGARTHVEGEERTDFGGPEHK
jgi:oligoendopeptidase F